MLRWLGLVDYEPTWRAMQAQVESRGPGSPDEIWFLEHPPVFTLGMNAKPEHLLAPGDIPVVQIDRGGQVTYHGPGQLVVYPLIDLERARLGAAFDVSFTHHDVPWVGESPEDLWDEFSEAFGPIVVLLRSLDDERAAQFREEMLASFAAFEMDGAIVMPRPFLLVRGTKRDA